MKAQHLIKSNIFRVTLTSASVMVIGCALASVAQAQAGSPGTSPVDQAPNVSPPPTPYDTQTPDHVPSPDNAPPTAQSAPPVANGSKVDSDGAIVVTGRFLDTGASSATKLNVRVLDTPFSVASYNGNFLKAIETTNVSDLYRYMTGIQRAGNTGYDISFRGFKSSGNDRNAILTDGMPGLTVRFGSPPTIGVDHVELVKGATSVLYGQAQPGGFLNIITKKPKDQASYDFELKMLKGIGSYGRELGGLASIDFTGPLDAAHRLDYRLVGEIGDTNGFRDDSYERPIYIAPSVAWKLDDRTTVTAQAEYRRIRTHYDTYLVAPNRDASKVAKIDTSYQEPNDYLVERGATGSLFVNHEFSSALKFNLGYRYVDHKDYQDNYDVVGLRNPTTVTRRARGQINKRTYNFVDANMTAKFDTFGIKHTLLFGAGYGKETASLDRTQFYNGTVADGLDVDLYNPIHGVVPDPDFFPLYNPGQAANLNWRYTTSRSLGAYASDLIEFGDMFKAMVGGRFADEWQTITDKRITTFVPEDKHDKKWLPLAGLLFEPMHNLTFYVSYSTSYVPVAPSNQDNFGNNPFKPTYSKSYEGGIKADLLHNRLNVTFAYYDIDKKGAIDTFNCLTRAQLIAAGVTIPAGATIATGTCSAQVGEERSRGLELEVNASPLPNWQITAGYSHDHARVVNSNVAVQDGARLTNAPDDAINFWSRYDFKNGALRNLGVGVGVSYIGKRAGLLPTAVTPAGAPDGGTLPLAAYTTVDLGLYYRVNERLDLTLKVSNLFDKRYIESAGFTGDIQLVPGTPRLLTATARLHL
jgi:iron complex outermembrane receptor protein